MLKNIFSQIKQLGKSFNASQPFLHAAALSYFSLLSLGPIILIVLNLVGIFFGREVAEDDVFSAMKSYFGYAGANALKAVIQGAKAEGKNSLTMITSSLILFFGASRVFHHLQIALNEIWGLNRISKGKPLLTYFRRKGLSMLMVVFVGILMGVSIGASTVLMIFLEWLANQSGKNVFIWQFIHFSTTILILSIFFSVLYKYLPERKISWKKVWLGAWVGAGLFSLGKMLFEIYLAHTKLGSSYGAAGSVVILMVWIYYASIIFLFGSFITKVQTEWKKSPSKIPQSLLASHGANFCQQEDFYS